MPSTGWPSQFEFVSSFDWRRPTFRYVQKSTFYVYRISIHLDFQGFSREKHLQSILLNSQNSIPDHWRPIELMNSKNIFSYTKIVIQFISNWKFSSYRRKRRSYRCSANLNEGISVRNICLRFEIVISMLELSHFRIPVSVCVCVCAYCSVCNECTLWIYIFKLLCRN